MLAYIDSINGQELVGDFIGIVRIGTDIEVILGTYI